MTSIQLNYTYLKYLLVRAASPASVIWRASKLSDLRDVNPDNFLKPLSVINVNERFKFSKFFKPGSVNKRYKIM